MRNISLNHALIARQVPLISTILLMIGMLLISLSVFYIQYLSNEIQNLNTRIEAFTHIHNKPKKLNTNSKDSKKAGDELIATNTVIAELVTPWIPLFNTLEAVERTEIKLMSVEPNMKKKVLRINAVAMDVDSMMRYIDDLSQQKMLKRVVLVSQQNADINAQPVLNFVVEALW